eukprot:TRINITY_DN3477_c0_g1_i2.p1 TRINITY_DN3477_c0_g1~~TRINITY_DN3477_c0_g1_i2.p1  ORF type:complete len:986 (-),score=291.18 TRINITY_DN3477_c0_g1_i2:42-2999(-)
MFGRKKDTPASPSLGKGDKGEKAAEAAVTPLSKSEQEATRRLFVLLVSCPRLLSIFEINGGMSSDDLCKGMISISQATGTTFDMIRHYIADDFKRHATADQGSIMRGNCIASKLTKEFLKRVGRDYLATLLSSSITQILESDDSFEIDPLKLEDTYKGEENINNAIAANKVKLVEAVKQIVTTITSTEMMDKLPAEVRVLSSYFGEFANNYAPEQFYPLVGGFLMLRWINPAITNPDAYGIVAENRITPMVRRNFILMTKVVQNLSNGVEFSNKESYMMPVNEFIKANFWRMEKYLRGVVSPISAPKIIEPNVSDVDYVSVHKIFAEHSQQIMDMCDNLPAGERNETTRQNIQELLDTFGQYRHIDNFLKGKFTIDENITIKFVVETGDATYETAVDGSVSLLQPLIQKMTTKLKKHEVSKKALKSKPTVESPQVFMRSLEDLMAQQSKYRIDIDIPQFIQESVNILMIKGLDKDMLFVKPGNQVMVDNLKKEIDKGNRVSFTNVDENTIAQLIKLYLRELPESLFPEETHRPLVDLGIAIQTHEQTNSSTGSSLNLKSTEIIVDKVKEFLRMLPKSHHSLLYTLCWLLYNIRKNCAVNLMTCPQLANVFGPILHRHKTASTPPTKPPRKPTMESIQFPKADMTQIQINKVVESLIKNFESVFEESINAAEEGVKSGLPFLRYRLITKSVQSISYVHPTGNLHGLAITAMGSRIQAWDLEHGSVMRVFEDRPEDKGSVTFVRVETDSQGRCSGRLWVMKENTTYIYDVKSSEIIYSIPRGGTSLTQYKHEMWINSIDTNFIYVYDVRNCKEIGQFPVQPNSVFQMGTFGDNVWAGSFNGGISVIQASTRALLNENKNGHKRKINTFVGTDRAVLAGSDDGTITQWNKDTFALERKVEAHAGKIKQLSFFNNIVWCTTWDMTMKMYTANFELVSEVKEHTDSVTGLIFHWSQKQKKWIMWSGSYDGTLCVFSIPALEPPKNPNQIM